LQRVVALLVKGAQKRVLRAADIRGMYIPQQAECWAILKAGLPQLSI